jgi:pectate lyase
MMGNPMQFLLPALLLTVRTLNAQLPAFPGAEGFGKNATGGRNGTVYHVTNLDDTGPGSFRDAVSQPNRIVVFDVGGVIHISTRIVIYSSITVAGQTAPGEGITVYGNGVALNDHSGNSIIRYIRIRMGKNGDSGKDAIGISEGTDYMFDHVSVSWGRDGTFDINGSGIDNISIQDCIIAQGINNENHSTGGLMQSGKFSIIRTLWIDNKTRNPKGRGSHDFINSVIYNWAEDGFIMGDTE